MLKSLKIFLIILGLGIFILPTQMLSAQTIEKCCSAESENKDCCKTETEKPCHSEQSSKEKGTSSCGNECANCHTCSILLISTSIPAGIYLTEAPAFSHQNVVFSYTIPFFSSKIQNIWQPPKLG